MEDDELNVGFTDIDPDGMHLCLSMRRDTRFIMCTNVPGTYPAAFSWPDRPG
jgi:hypothetical protein